MQNKWKELFIQMSITLENWKKRREFFYFTSAKPGSPVQIRPQLYEGAAAVQNPDNMAHNWTFKEKQSRSSFTTSRKVAGGSMVTVNCSHVRLGPRPQPGPPLSSEHNRQISLEAQHESLNTSDSLDWTIVVVPNGCYFNHSVFYQWVATQQVPHWPQPAPPL